MTDQEKKVIKGLEICSAGEWNSTGGRDHTNCPYYPAGYTGCTCKLLMRDALALLRNNEAVKPELRMSKYGFKQWIVCGNCYGKIYGLYDYCPWCGRKIKWNNKENEDGF